MIAARRFPLVPTVCKRGIWMPTWGGDREKFDKQFEPASASERRKLIEKVDPTSGWTAVRARTQIETARLLARSMRAPTGDDETLCLGSRIKAPHEAPEGGSEGSNAVPPVVTTSQ